MIKNLLFDLGGVIMDIDRNCCVKTFESLGMREIDSLLGLYGQKGVFLELESGLISPADFRTELRKKIPGEVSDRQIDDAFNEFLLGIPVERLRWLEQLRKEYPVYLLSNTNEIMMESKIKDSFRADGHDINHYFDGIVTSYEAKCCKPARKIFDYASEKLGINPAETLFFDDSQANVDAARSYGYQAVRVRPGEEFMTILNNYIKENEDNK